MEEYIGLDVSKKETAASIRREGQRVLRGTCVTDPGAISRLLCKRAPAAKRAIFDTGPLAVWRFHALSPLGVPVICMDARHAKAALDMARNKTDGEMGPWPWWGRASPTE